jgi:hypothetical protein
LVTDDRFRGGAPPELGNLGLQGSKQPGLGSSVISAACVTHLGLLRGSEGAQAARTTTGAVRHGGVSPARAFRLQGRVWVHYI